MVKRRRPVPPTGVGGMGGGEGFLKDVNHTKIRILITTITAAIYVNSLWCDFVFGKLKENILAPPFKTSRNTGGSTRMVALILMIIPQKYTFCIDNPNAFLAPSSLKNPFSPSHFAENISL